MSYKSVYYIATTNPHVTLNNNISLQCQKV